MAQILKVRDKLSIALIALLVTSLFYGCREKSKTEKERPDGFVELIDGKFEINGQPFFPLMLNYVADFRKVNEKCILGVHSLYEKPGVYEYFSTDSIALQRNEHLKLISEMGFNSIRLCLDRIWSSDGKIGYPTAEGILDIHADRDELLTALDDFLADAGQNDLKVLLLIAPPIQNDSLADFTKALLEKFSTNPVLFAYDFNNEPLYDQAHSKIPKREVFEIVSDWKEWMENRAPWQLLTIGYSEPIEVFSWDPSILPVDFISFHTYNPLRVPNEIYWYARFSGKPWMIGETALLADNQTIPYQWQVDFLKSSFQKTLDCGGIGYAWWGFQEVPKFEYDEESTGIMTTEGTIYTSDSLLPITAQFKPVVNTFKTLSPSSGTASCSRPENYFNMLGYRNYMLTGKLVDSKGEPIEGGLIRGWNINYAVGQNTFSDSLGNFNLYSNDRIRYLQISAPAKETLRFDQEFIYIPIANTATPEEDLPERDLEYQKIDYRDYMQTDSAGNLVFFKYKPEIFDTAQYKGHIGTIELRDWKNAE